MTDKYSKPTSSIDAAGDLVIRVPASTIRTLTERWWIEGTGENKPIRVLDTAGLAESVSRNIHGYGDEFFPGAMTAIESWIGGSGVEAICDSDFLSEEIPEYEIVQPRQVFFGEWKKYYPESLVSDFDIRRSDLIGVEFLVAGYDLSDEGGSAVVLFARGGKLWKVYGAHIADGDFRDQWKPVETTIDAMRRELPIVSGAVRHEDLIVSMHQALDELETEAQASHKKLNGPSRLEIYHASADVLGTSLRGIATALHAMDKPDAIRHVRGLIDALQTTEGVLAEPVLDNYGPTVGVACYAYRKLLPGGGYEAIVEDLPDVSELAKHRYWVSLDFETTGLKEEDRIIQVGGIRLDNLTGERIDFQTLVDPEGAVSTDEAIGIHGITAERLAGAPRWPHVRPTLRSLLEDSLLVCQNIEFEKRFLESHGYEPNWCGEVDTKLLAQMYVPGLPSYSLGPIAVALGIEDRVGGHHDALEDARMALAVFTAIVARLPDQEAETPAAA